MRECSEAISACPRSAADGVNRTDGKCLLAIQGEIASQKRLAMTISFTAVILTCDYENAQIRLTFSGWTKSQPYVEDSRSETPGSGG